MIPGAGDSVQGRNPPEKRRIRMMADFGFPSLLFPARRPFYDFAKFGPYDVFLHDTLHKFKYCDIFCKVEVREHDASAQRKLPEDDSPFL